MQVTVEFLGSAFVAAGRKSVSIDVPQQCRGVDILEALAKAVPSLVGRVIEKDKRSLILPNVMDVNGVQAIADWEAPLTLAPGSTLAIGQEPC